MKRIIIVLWTLLLIVFGNPAISADLDVDLDSNGAVDINRGGTNATTAALARTSLGLAIGTDIQAYDADLTTYAGITPSADIQTFLAYANFAAIKAGLSVDDLITLSGVADGSTHLGSFDGSTITSDVTIKVALQDLETSHELKADKASPTFSGTMVLPPTVAGATGTRIRTSSETDAEYIGLGAWNGTAYQDVVRIVNDTGGVPEFQLQSGAAFTGLGNMTVQDTGVIRNETDTSDDYFRLQATDEVGGTPAQIDLIRITNAGVAGEVTLKLGDGGGSNYWQIDQSGDMTPAGTATLKVPATAPASLNQVSVDATTDQFQYYGASLRAVSPKLTYSIVVPSVAATDDSMFVKLPYGITVTALDCIVSAATSATINIVECNGTGTCSDEMATADLVCDTDGATTSTFGGAAGAAADSGDWLQLKIESISGTPGTLTVTLTYNVTAD